MTLQDAANLYTVGKAEQDVLTDPTLSWRGKMQALTALQNAAAQPAPPAGLTISAGDVVRGAVGAGLGYGVGALMGKLFGVSPQNQSIFRGLGMGLGTLMNTGVMMNKTSHARVEQERRDAFRFGFVKAALAVGLIKTSVHSVIPLTPELATGPINAGLAAGASAASNVGGILGQIVGADDTDVDMEKMQLEQRQLEQQATQLKAHRNAQVLKQMLAKRQQRPAGRVT